MTSEDGKTHEPPGESRGRVPQPLAFAAAIAVWIVAAGLPGTQPVAQWIGMLVFHLVAALLIRWIYTRRQVPRPPLVAPTLFLIAAGVALLGRLGPSSGGSV